MAGKVLVRPEGVCKLGTRENACGLAAAYKALWAVEGEDGQSCEDLIGRRWDEDQSERMVADGYQQDFFEQDGVAVDAFAKDGSEGSEAGR